VNTSDPAGFDRPPQPTGWFAFVELVAKEDNAHMINVSASEQFRDAPTCPHPSVSSTCGFMAGYFDAIQLAGSEAHQQTIPELIHQRIQMEIDAEPKHVGPPIRVLRLDSSGPQGLSMEKACALGIPGEK
jgi:hypothetical protein